MTQPKPSTPKSVSTLIDQVIEWIEKNEEEMTWDFRSYTYKPEFRDGAYQVNWDEMDIVDILKEGFEPFQVVPVGTGFTIFFKRPSK